MAMAAGSLLRACLRACLHDDVGYRAHVWRKTETEAKAKCGAGRVQDGGDAEGVHRRDRREMPAVHAGWAHAAEPGGRVPDRLPCSLLHERRHLQPRQVPRHSLCPTLDGIPQWLHACWLVAVELCPSTQPRLPLTPAPPPLRCTCTYWKGAWCGSSVPMGTLVNTGIKYRVREGDDLFSLAERFFTNVPHLLSVNPGSSPLPLHRTLPCTAHLHARTHTQRQQLPILAAACCHLPQETPARDTATDARPLRSSGAACALGGPHAPHRSLVPAAAAAGLMHVRDV